MPLRWDHQVTLAGKTRVGRLSVLRILTLASGSPEDAPQVIDLHEPHRR